MNHSRAYISSRYQEYPATDASTLRAEAIPKQLEALDKALRIVARCDRRVEIVQKQVDRPKLVQQDRRLGKVWKTARELQNYGKQLFSLVGRYHKLDLKQQIAEPTIASLVNDSESVALLIDHISHQPPTTAATENSYSERLQDKTISLVKHVAILKSIFGEHRAELMLEQRACMVGKRVTRVARALFDEPEDHKISSVLERFREKGWKVDIRQNDVDRNLDPEDSFTLSLALLERIKRPATGLLLGDQYFGALVFPVVLRVNSKLSDHLVKLCTGPSVGYNLYVVFGGYVAIDNVVALGIRHDLVETEDRKKQPKLDTHKFMQCLPEALVSSQSLLSKFGSLQPVQPAKITGHYYYTLMLPHGTLGESRHAIGDWTFLTA